MKTSAWTIIALLFFAAGAANVMADERRDTPKKTDAGKTGKDKKATAPKHKTLVAKSTQSTSAAYVAQDPKTFGLGCSAGEK